MMSEVWKVVTLTEVIQSGYEWGFGNADDVSWYERWLQGYGCFIKLSWTVPYDLCNFFCCCYNVNETSKMLII